MTCGRPDACLHVCRTSRLARLPHGVLARLPHVTHRPASRASSWRAGKLHYCDDAGAREHTHARTRTHARARTHSRTHSWRAWNLHHGDLVMQGLHVSVLGQAQLLDGDPTLSALVLAKEYGSHAALPNRLHRHVVANRRVFVDKLDSQLSLPARLLLSRQLWFASLMPTTVNIRHDVKTSLVKKSTCSWWNLRMSMIASPCSLASSFVILLIFSRSAHPGSE